MASTITRLSGTEYAQNGWYAVRFADTVMIHATSQQTVTGTYSTSTGRYFQTLTFTLPTNILSLISGKTHCTILLSVESGGIYEASPVQLNTTTGLLTYYVSSLTAFTDQNVKIHIILIANS